nr:hypothetical protein HAGR004_41840 [Bdellovibrio sp. HAGR004]
MGRAERRKQERFLKKKGTPVSHLHSHYLPSELDSMRSEIKEFLRTYEFKGSLFQEDYERELGIKKMFPNSLVVKRISDVDEGIMTLEQNYPIFIKETKEIIKMDIFLVREKNGWFIKYDKVPYSQNILIAIKETGFEYMMNNDLNVASRFYGYLIPYANRIIRKALDRLTLRYGDEWVNL